MGTIIARHSSRQCARYSLKSGVGTTSSVEDLYISGSVGVGGRNVERDIIRVQNVVNRIPESLGGAGMSLNESGRADAATIAAIKKFQRFHFGSEDGRVDAGGRTQAKLSSLLPAKIERLKATQPYLSQARDCILAAQTKVLIAATELRTGGGGIGGTRNLDLIDKHFEVRKSSDPSGVLSHIKNIYTTMLAVFQRPGGLLGWSAFEGEPFSDPNLYAFTLYGGYRLAGRYDAWARLDTIYLSKGLDGAGADQRIATIVHELAHFVGPEYGDLITDYGYGWLDDPKISRLTPYQKQHNADCFSNLAFDAKFGRAPV